MTADKLYEILKFLDTLDGKLGLQKSLEAIGAALNNLVGSPAEPRYQTLLAQALTSFESAAAKLAAAISPSQMAAIKAMGGEEFFDPSIADKVKNAVQMNAMTPSVARDFVQELASRRANFLTTVRNARQSLEGLQIKESELRTGSADLAFLIPRDIFKNQLGPFAKELGFINRLIEHFSEAITGQAQPAELEQLSSSVPTVALWAAVPVIGIIATVVDKFLNAWEKIEKIRKIRAELTDIGLKGKAVEELTEQIKTTVEEVVEESTELVLAHYKGDDGRKSELDTAIRQDTRRLFGQIERGLTVEFRAKGDEAAKEDENQKILVNIDNLAMGMKFPEVPREPMLLSSGELLEGDIRTVKHSKKTTTHKTTVSKKETQKDAKQEAKE